uniref:Nucleolar complex protein 3 homolog n=1 Tax=Odontella aurita TaxID=265563 RepID=A0A7S4K774_9STRA
MDVPVGELTPQRRCDLIADLSESILEDPSTAFSSLQTHGGQRGRAAEVDDESAEDPQQYRIPSKMGKVLELADPSTRGNDERTSRLATLSALAVFQDVLPTYRIRLPTDAERSVRVTKETKKLWDYERRLLQHYQRYLKLLERTWSSGRDAAGSSGGGGAPSGLAVASILCLCELLKAAPHFNFRSNVLSVVVRQMNHGGCDEVSGACCAAVSHLFATDAQGEVALEAARLVAKMAKERKLAIRPEVLRTLLSLPLRVHEDEAQAAKIAQAANAKKRKRDREAAEVDSDLKEGEASVDKIILARAQSDTLQAVTLTYFRVLKADGLSDGRAAELLPPALEGLAKFAHLINMDTVEDLLDVLRAMLKRAGSLPLDAALNCVLTAFQTLEGPGREMQIDPKEYVLPLYAQIPRLGSESGARHTDLALRCMTSAFLRRKEYSSVRVAAFVKRLSSAALHAPPPASAAMLCFVRQLLARYPSSQRLLENEQDIVASGAYAPDAEDPEHSNPYAASVWELALLRFRAHAPVVAEQADGAAAGRALRPPAETPERIFAELTRDGSECYVAQRANRRKHPLSVGEGKRRRQQARFITPRRTGNHHLKK